MTTDLDPDLIKRVLKRDLLNIQKRVAQGERITKEERTLLYQHVDGIDGLGVRPKEKVGNKAELARQLGLTKQALNWHVKKGDFPKPDESGFYDVALCHEWLRAHGMKDFDESEDYESAKLRVTQADANLKEAKLAELERRLVPIDQVQSAWEASLTALRQRILAMTFLKEELRHEILEELSSIPIEEYFKREDGLDADEVDQVKEQVEK